MEKRSRPRPNLREPTTAEAKLRPPEHRRALTMPEHGLQRTDLRAPTQIRPTPAARMPHTPETSTTLAEKPANTAQIWAPRPRSGQHRGPPAPEPPRTQQRAEDAPAPPRAGRTSTWPEPPRAAANSSPHLTAAQKANASPPPAARTTPTHARPRHQQGTARPSPADQGVGPQIHMERPPLSPEQPAPATPWRRAAAALEKTSPEGGASPLPSAVGALPAGILRQRRGGERWKLVAALVEEVATHVTPGSDAGAYRNLCGWNFNLE